jgi:3-deoxy-7-phosphoheptulonate synthase
MARVALATVPAAADTLQAVPTDVRSHALDRGADDAWSPASWRTRTALHQPAWPDEARLVSARADLAGQPPLVFAGEARRLRAGLADACEGRAFLLQAGECAESFDDHSAPSLRERLKILLQMAVVLTYGATLPVVKVMRIAGQFAKPRSRPTERVGDIEIPSFLGHMVNSPERTAEARVPDPDRMLRAYHQAAATLNLLRAFTKGGFADITRVHEWNQEFVSDSPEGRRYDAVASEIDRALAFMAACGIDLQSERHLHEVDVFTSHEALLLDYEEPLTRRDSTTGDWYDCSAHFLWIGERTRQLDGAHVEFLRGVHNPIGVKLGPGATPGEVDALCERLNPDRVPGRLTLVTRLGADRVGELLPPLIAAARDEGHPVVWVCDPMHANVFTTASGYKTRHFDAIMREIEGFFLGCAETGVRPGGIHLEYTGEAVTECLGGPSGAVLEEQLSQRYETLCDPRLNARQSLDLAFRVAELMRAIAARNGRLPESSELV